MNQRERNIAILAAVAVGGYGLYAGVFEPLLSRLDQAKNNAALAQSDLDAADNLERRQINERRDWKRIAGTSVAEQRSIAEGQLINAVPGWARSADLNLTSIKPEPAESEKGFGKVVVRAAAIGDLTAVAKFLYEVQTADIPVRVADLTLASGGDGEGQLVVQVGLSTIYRLPDEEDRT